MITVTTQEELDAVLKSATDPSRGPHIEIRTNQGVRVAGRSHVTVSGDSVVVASEHAHVTATESASVIAHDDAHVSAYDSSCVDANNNSVVIAHDTARVDAHNRAHVTTYSSEVVTAYNDSIIVARGVADVMAQDRVLVHARDRSHVRAQDRVRVRAFGDASVIAFGHAHVGACQRTSVEAYENCNVVAGDLVPVRVSNDGVTVTGGIIINCAAQSNSPTDPTQWAARHGAAVHDGVVTLYKALPENLVSGREFGRDTVWQTTGEVECDDWNNNPFCGGGLHLSPTPSDAMECMTQATKSPRFLRCQVPLNELVVIPSNQVPKCKARRVTVVEEVDLAGRPVVEVD